MRRNFELNTRSGFWIALSFAACLLLAGTALAQNTEWPVSMRDLPQAVRATVKTESQGAVVRGISKEIDNGQTFYELSLRVKGRVKDVLMDPDGKIVEVEEQVTLASLPPAVKSAIEKQADKGRILLVESVTKNGALVFYEAHIKTGRKVSEFKVGLDGRPVSE
jgi:hypothetical protein